MQLYIRGGIDPDSNRQRKQLAGGGSKKQQDRQTSRTRDQTDHQLKQTKR